MTKTLKQRQAGIWTPVPSKKAPTPLRAMTPEELAFCSPNWKPPVEKPVLENK